MEDQNESTIIIDFSVYKRKKICASSPKNTVFFNTKFENFLNLVKRDNRQNSIIIIKTKLYNCYFLFENEDHFICCVSYNDIDNNEFISTHFLKDMFKIIKKSYDNDSYCNEFFSMILFHTMANYNRLSKSIIESMKENGKGKKNDKEKFKIIITKICDDNKTYQIVDKHFNVSKKSILKTRNEKYKTINLGKSSSTSKKWKNWFKRKSRKKKRKSNNVNTKKFSGCGRIVSNTIGDLPIGKLFKRRKEKEEDGGNTIKLDKELEHINEEEEVEENNSFENIEVKNLNKGKNDDDNKKQIQKRSRKLSFSLKKSKSFASIRSETQKQSFALTALGSQKSFASTGLGSQKLFKRFNSRRNSMVWYNMNSSISKKFFFSRSLKKWDCQDVLDWLKLCKVKKSKGKTLDDFTIIVNYFIENDIDGNSLYSSYIKSNEQKFFCTNICKLLKQGNVEEYITPLDEKMIKNIKRALIKELTVLKKNCNEKGALYRIMMKRKKKVLTCRIEEQFYRIKFNEMSIDLKLKKEENDDEDEESESDEDEKTEEEEEEGKGEGEDENENVDKEIVIKRKVKKKKNLFKIIKVSAILRDLRKSDIVYYTTIKNLYEYIIILMIEINTSNVCLERMKNLLEMILNVHANLIREMQKTLIEENIKIHDSSTHNGIYKAFSNSFTKKQFQCYYLYQNFYKKFVEFITVNSKMIEKYLKTHKISLRKINDSLILPFRRISQYAVMLKKCLKKDKSNQDIIFKIVTLISILNRNMNKFNKIEGKGIKLHEESAFLGNTVKIEENIERKEKKKKKKKKKKKVKKKKKKKTKTVLLRKEDNSNNKTNVDGKK